MDRPTDLPDFEEPPLTEVALSLQFDPLPGLQLLDIGLLWEKFRDRFPHVEYHPRLASTFETFGLPHGVPQFFPFHLPQPASPPRLWFVDPLGNEVLQFQTDRFVRNWRKVGEAGSYPRYEQVRERFKADFQIFSAFLKERGHGTPVPNQCEVTYVNVVTVPGASGDLTTRVFRGWQLDPVSLLGDLEDVALTARFIIRDGTGEPVGRVTVQSSPGVDVSGQPVIQLLLVGRGAPASQNLDSSLDFMDLARDRIVRRFADLTADDMHRLWKRRT